jgi:exopolysaccharide biosynthesis polyprenyl glycosylphosphotransferase
MTLPLILNTAKRRFLLGSAKLFYVGVLALSLGVATALSVALEHGSADLPVFFSMRVKLWNCLVLALLLLMWHGILSLCGFYQSKRLSNMSSLVVDAIRATTLSALTLILAAKVFHIEMLSFTLIAVFWILSCALVIIARATLRYSLGKIRLRGHNLRHVLVLGTNHRAVDFARRIEGKSELGYRVVGFVDEEWPGLQGFQQTSYELCCSLEELSGYLRQNVVDEVAIYLPLRSFYERTSQVVALCEQHGITLRFASDIFNLRLARSHADDLDGDSHIALYAGSLDGWGVLVKRVLDIALSLTLLILLAPLLAAVALLIKLTCDGPVLFRQERVGLNKRRFRIYKFRTMVPNADSLLPQLEMLNEVSGPVFKIKNDPRMTPIGRYLRRSSLDELPQLFNVLKGDMSLVGPRPLPLRDFEGFSKDWQRRRFSIRPGITCLWQVSGRSGISFEKWMQLDLQYMDEWSLWLDLKILALTVPAVLRGSGAA